MLCNREETNRSSKGSFDTNGIIGWDDVRYVMVLNSPRNPWSVLSIVFGNTAVWVGRKLWNKYKAQLMFDVKGNWKIRAEIVKIGVRTHGPIRPSSQRVESEVQGPEISMCRIESKVSSCYEYDIEERRNQIICKKTRRRKWIHEKRKKKGVEWCNFSWGLTITSGHYWKAYQSL